MVDRARGADEGAVVLTADEEELDELPGFVAASMAILLIGSEHHGELPAGVGAPVCNAVFRRVLTFPSKRPA